MREMVKVLKNHILFKAGQICNKIFEWAFKKAAASKNRRFYINIATAANLALVKCIKITDWDIVFKGGNT